jgi:hypothetical protein
VRVLAAALSLALAACGRPGELEVQVTPERTFYAIGDRVRLEAVIDGAPAPVRWSLDDGPISEELETLDVVVGRPGWTIVTACRGESCDRVGLFGDDGPPMLELTTPQPGALIGQEGFDVSGRAFGDPASTFVSIDGYGPVELAADGTFFVEIAPARGVNHLVVRATDGMSAEVIELDVLFSEQSRPITLDGEGAFISVDRAFAVALGDQAFSNDGLLPSDATTLLRLVDAITPHVDALALAPDPLIEPDVRVVSATLLVLAPSGLRWAGDGSGRSIACDVRLDAVLEGTLDGVRIDGTAQLSLLRESTWQLSTQGGRALAQRFYERDVSILLRTQLADPDAQAWIARDDNPARARLIDALSQLAADVNDAAIEQTWAGVAPSLLPSQHIALGPGIGATIEVALGQEQTFDGAASAAFDVAIRPTGPAPRLRSTMPAFQHYWRSSSPTAVMTHTRHALFEALVHLAWAQGAFDHAGDDLRIDPVLPPALAWTSARYQLVLTLGQIEIDVDIDGAARRFAASYMIDLAAAGVSCGLVSQGQPRIDVWPIDGAAGSVEDEEIVIARLAAALERSVRALELEVAVPVLSTDRLEAAFPAALFLAAEARALHENELWSESLSCSSYWAYR